MFNSHKSFGLMVIEISPQMKFPNLQKSIIDTYYWLLPFLRAKCFSTYFPSFSLKDNDVCNCSLKEKRAQLADFSYCQIMNKK